MNRKVKLTLSIDATILQEYKEFTNEEGLIISKQVENFMVSQLRKRK